jgi:uncharacterized heparinase superfamily protein
VPGRLEKLSWYFSRWQAMDHPSEDIYRLRQFARNQLFDRVVAGSTPGPPSGFAYRDRTGIVFSERTLARLQPEAWPVRRFPLLSITLDDLENIRDWRKDYRNGPSSPLDFAGDISAQDFSTVGDVKYVAVLSRLHFLPFLAVEAVAHGKRSSMRLIERMLLDWTAQNPYLLGINWKTGIEVGIRVLNLVIARKILILGDPPSELLKIIDRIVYSCFHFLERHQSLFSSANNHLTAELLGMIVVLSHYDHPSRVCLLNAAARLFKDELFSQNYPDGGNREQSVQYQVQVLDAWTTGMWLLQTTGHDLDRRRVAAQLSAMGEFLQCFVSDDGVSERIGDDDEGHYLFPYQDPGYVQSLSVLNSLALLVGDSRFLSAPRFDLRLYLIGGDHWEGKFRSQAATTHIGFQVRSRWFADSGYAFFVGKDSRLLMDVGEIGLRPMAAHGHSDLLGFTLRVKDRPFLVDPGTYQYHSRTPYRQYFRSVNAHNTLSVNGLDQARSGGRMIWLKQPAVRAAWYHQDSNEIVCEAEHDGFARQGVPVIHRRRIRYQSAANEYEITDWLRGETECEVAIGLHFHPDVELVKQAAARYIAHSDGCTICLENPQFDNAVLYRGSEDPIMGWYSGAYDVKVPCWTLRIELSTRGALQTQTLIRLLE